MAAPRSQIGSEGASRSTVNMLMAGMQVPTPSADRRMGDVLVGAKRPMRSTRDFVDTMTQVTSRRRFVTGDSGMQGMRTALPRSLAAGMTLINAGFSTDDAQTDEIITMPIFAKPFQQGWEADYVENVPLFCNRVEPDATSLQMFTVASPQVINFALELGSLTRARGAIVGRTGLASELVELAEYLEYMTADDAQQFGERWNYLGPMTSFKDAGVHSSSASVRRSQGAQRMLGFSAFNRCKSFNLFAPHIGKGEYCFFGVKERDVSHLRNFVDPRGEAVVARTTYPATALQMFGFTQSDSPVGAYGSTAYDPTVGPESFKDPRAGDRDYVARARRIVQDYKPIEYDAETDTVRYVLERDATVQEYLAETPEIVYRAYMEGWAKRVGFARHFEGRAGTASGIANALRSHQAMLTQQVVEIVNL